MAFLGEEWRFTVLVGDEKVVVSLREATNEEINKFLSARVEVKAKGRTATGKDRSFEARGKLFDDLVLKVETLEDKDGPITADTPERIPGKWKNDAILQKYEESNCELDEGN